MLREDGKDVSIRYFSHDSNRPVTLAILVDTSGSQRDFVPNEIGAADLFIEALLDGKEDRATLVQFDRTVSQLGSLTNSIDTLGHALPLLASQVPEALTDQGPADPHPRRGWTVLNDAIYTTSKSVLAKESGRKAMVVLTDGCDFGSKTTLAQAIEQAQRADVQIYSILYSNWTLPSTRPSFRCDGSGAVTSENPGLPVLEKLSSSTGGEVFSVSKATPLREIFAQITQRIRTAYELGYTPSADLAPNSYHRLDLKVKDKHFTVRTRQGFYAVP